MQKTKRLLDAYHYPGFRPKAKIKGIFGDSRARIIELVRRQKKRSAGVVEQVTGVSTTRKYGESGTFLVEKCESTWKWQFAVSFAGGVEK